MFSRIKILYQTRICSFNADWLIQLVDQYLEFEQWDPTQVYPPGTLFYLNCLDLRSALGREFCQQRVDQGFKVVIDNLWEMNPGPTSGAFTLCCERWFWYNESLWYRHWGYDQYQPQRTVNYLALMPIYKHMAFRSNFLNQVEPVLDRMIWSYVEHGRQLPNDRVMGANGAQRYFDPDWYNHTYASMVVETHVHPASEYTPIFISEKTMKPLAFQHPFIVYGNCGTLSTLKKWGFETFDNIWNEDYDDIADNYQRQTAVATLLKTLTTQQHDKETLQRIQHNRDHFFNRDLAQQRIVQEILEPIINYAETR
jgi:hypothetical protein